MQISTHCFAITGLGYVPPWTVNSGFITGGHTTLIVDTGANALAAQTIHGYASLARPANRIAVINSEKHFDHIGGNGYFRERGIDIYGHAAVARTDAEFRDQIDEVNSAIPCPVRRARNEAEVFYSGTRLAMPNLPLDRETTLDLGDLTVQILFTPGHTATNLSVWVPDDATLFCGDCLVNGYLPNLDAGTLPEWRQWLASLDRVAQLNAIVIVCGHGPVVIGEEVPRLIESVRGVLRHAIEIGKSPTAG